MMVEALVYRRPDPALVARILDGYGLDAALERWGWLGRKTIQTLAQEGRATAGAVVVGIPSRRTYSELDELVCLEAAFLLDGPSAGERAAGIRDGAAHELFRRRGVEPPRCQRQGRLSALARLARAGNTPAALELERIRSHERAVGDVLRRALPLVDPQPVRGRARLPRRDDRLRAALDGCDRVAIETVFPGLAVEERLPGWLLDILAAWDVPATADRRIAA
ncbi:hypothetical protein [Salinarimonas rosea]|uniref:hypothetical protein n=1 Tax=Salinarimonas rosea TaxID=552063 RepID=UPI0004178791|nr:hypothetical protein [Salinarimonas rosea]